MKKLLSLVLIGVMTLSMAGCSKNEEDGKIIVGTNAEFPPFEFIADNESGVLGRYDGIDMAIAKKIGEKTGKEIEVMDMPFDSLALKYQSGEVDLVIAAMTITDERKANMDFSIPYYTSKQYIVVPIDNTDINTGADLNGKRIGVQTGTTGDFISTEDVENAEVARYNRPFEAINAVINGDIDAVVVDIPVAKLYVNQYPDQLKIIENTSEFPEEQYGIAVEKGNTELMDAVNSTLTEMMESGELDQIAVEYSEINY